MSVTLEQSIEIIGVAIRNDIPYTSGGGKLLGRGRVKDDVVDHVYYGLLLSEFFLIPILGKADHVLGVGYDDVDRRACRKEFDLRKGLDLAVGERLGGSGRDFHVVPLGIRQPDLDAVGSLGNGDKEFLSRIRQGQVRADEDYPVFFDGIEVRGLLGGNRHCDYLVQVGILAAVLLY